MTAPGGSFLDVLGQSILDSASSIDAHIDAGALIDRISGDAEPSSSAHRARQFALAELKSLAKRAPAAVVATEGAVVAILRVVEKLSPKGDQEIEDENVESLQEALECLGCLMDDGATKVVGKSEVKEDTSRAQLVAELIVKLVLISSLLVSKDHTDWQVKHSENGKQLLRLLCVSETSTQYDAMVLLQKIYLRLPEPVNSAILADPRSLGHLMHVLQSSPIDYVRNESLGLLLLITASNTDIQTIVTVQGFIETIFSILEDEDLAAGGKVARDLLQCLINVVGNATCQKYLRETNGAASIVSAISLAVTGRRSEEDEEEEEYEKREGEHRWSCLSMLVDAALALAQSDQAEANRLALVKAGALELLQHLAEPMAEVPQLRLVQLFEALEPCHSTAERLQSFARRRAPLLFDLVAVLLGPVTPLALRNALGRVLCRCIARHSPLQSFFCSSLGPELQEEPNEDRSRWKTDGKGDRICVFPLKATPAGRLVVELLEVAARGGGVSPEALWFALQLLLATLIGNASVQSAYVAMPVSIPSDAGPAETFQELLPGSLAKSRVLRGHWTCIKPYILSMTVAAHTDEAESDTTRPTESASLVGFLKLILYWLANCASVLSNFATSPVMIPVVMDLTSFSGGAFYTLQVQGLACLVMGACIMSENEATDSMTLISQRIGIETFQQKVECLWRSEALQRPARSLGDFRWYNGHFRHFVRGHQRAVQRRMVQLYVSQDLLTLAQAADEMRTRTVGQVVTYVVNRNINFTNVCVKRCGFCAFSRTGVDHEGYFLPLPEILRRADEAKRLGATEVCIQAGLPPNMQGSLYESIARSIKENHPDIHIHAFSPEEVLWGAKCSNTSVHDFLLKLKDAGVDSLPGTSAEILDNDLRKVVAKGRLSVEEWTTVVTTAHSLGFPTTATMMFGFCESPRHLARHLVLLRDIQKKAQDLKQIGFTEFVPLGFVPTEAPMWKTVGSLPVRPGPTGAEVLRAHAVARLVFNPMLPGGIRNIQVSWVKEGFKTAQWMLLSGANDLGGTLMNESISTAAGAGHGQLAKPADLRRVAWELQRPVAQRTTSYDLVRCFDSPSGSSWEDILEAENKVNLANDKVREKETTRTLDAVSESQFGSFHQLIASSEYRFAKQSQSPALGRRTNNSKPHTSTGPSRHFSSQAHAVKSGIVTYSPSYTMVPTYECFNVCTYCNFRKNVTKKGDWMSYESAKQKFSDLSEASASHIDEILVMAGEVHPQASNREAWMLRAETICLLALDYGFLPHTNIGPLSRDEMKRLFQVNASMGLMLETTCSLNGHGAVHQFAPSKDPKLRINQIRQAGELQVPFTTGLLIGIGETHNDRLHALEIIASLAEEFNHIQEVILQPHALGSNQKLKPKEDGHGAIPSKSDYILFGNDAVAELPRLVKFAREILPATVQIQIPPNLILHGT
eukprot:symbB.v1.2.020483.t1/scaffold1729.1/size181395/20